MPLLGRRGPVYTESCPEGHSRALWTPSLGCGQVDMLRIASPAEELKGREAVGMWYGSQELCGRSRADGSRADGPRAGVVTRVHGASADAPARRRVSTRTLFMWVGTLMMWVRVSALGRRRHPLLKC